MKTNIPSRLSNTELVAEVSRLARCEHETTAQLIAHLAEFDTRGLYLGAGFSSLFSYCTEILRLSEHEAELYFGLRETCERRGCGERSACSLRRRVALATRSRTSSGV